jgi:hypothetical protein
MSMSHTKEFLQRRKNAKELSKHYANYSYHPVNKNYTHFRRRMLERYHLHVNYESVTQMKQLILDNKAEYLGDQGCPIGVYKIPVMGLLLKDNPGTTHKFVVAIYHPKGEFFITALPRTAYANVVYIPPMSESE